MADSRQLEILSSDEIDRMRRAGRLAAELLARLGGMVEPGVTTGELDDEAVRFAEEHGAEHAPLDYKGFPRSICTSINEVVCHGIPDDDRELEEGDIVAIDVTPVVDDFHGDTCATFFVGEPEPEAVELVEVTAEALRRGLKQVRAGKRIGDIGASIQNYVESQGFSVVRDFIGHGIGRSFHAAPQVPHFGSFNTGMRMRPGMAFTIEPMVNVGDYPTQVLSDDWTAVTADGSLSAQFEHTIIVERDGVEVTTVPEGQDPLEVSPAEVVDYDESDG
ncbi:MAG: type I methionyl aminopeptidase [Bradymonadaceae bacterium]